MADLRVVGGDGNIDPNQGLGRVKKKSGFLKKLKTEISKNRPKIH